MPPLGLPDAVTACLFDLDGVLTDTAAVHSKAWKEMFDDFLRAWAQQSGLPFVPFDEESDYQEYVDGKPREAGVRDFLASRDIHLADGDGGTSGDSEQPTVQALGDRKNAIVQRRIAEDGVRVFEGSRRYLQAAAEAGLRRAVVSSSANTAQILHVTGLEEFIEERIDGVTAKERRLAGKPAPDTFLAGAAALGVPAAQAAVFEDALAGVEAGRAGRFGCVIGVDRVGHGPALKTHGADVVVTDLAQLLPGGSGS